eukprot:SAG11_NODE_10068_length_859_cov_1.059211_1_plen_74_part_10
MFVPRHAKLIGRAHCSGVAHSFEFVPAGYTIETVLVASLADLPPNRMSAPQRVSVPSGGVNAALFEYGDLLLSR